MNQFFSPSKETRKVYFFFFLAILVFIIDHSMKLLALQGKCIGVCLTPVTNSGAAFSLFENFSFITVILVLIALIVLFFSVFFYVKYSERSRLLMYSLPLIFIGTLSNMLDRIFFGYVVDYIPFFSTKLFTFNIADLSNFVGVILLVVFLLKKK